MQPVVDALAVHPDHAAVLGAEREDGLHVALGVHPYDRVSCRVLPLSEDIVEHHHELAVGLRLRVASDRLPLKVLPRLSRVGLAGLVGGEIFFLIPTFCD